MFPGIYNFCALVLWFQKIFQANLNDAGSSAT
jgi:hypothetical protein